jgi:hypothetical protein
MLIPPGMGDCCQVMVLVISQRPGFLEDCAEAEDMIRKHKIAIKTEVLCISSPLNPAPHFTAMRGKEESKIDR